MAVADSSLPQFLSAVVLAVAAVDLVWMWVAGLLERSGRSF